MSLNDNIEPISEQTANELFDVIKRAHHMAVISNDSINKSIESLRKHYERIALYESLRQTYFIIIYSEKINKAMFLTRWYWKKKLNKAEIKLNKVEEWLNKFNNK